MNQATTNDTNDTKLNHFFDQTKEENRGAHTNNKESVQKKRRKKTDWRNK